MIRKNIKLSILGFVLLQLTFFYFIFTYFKAKIPDKYYAKKFKDEENNKINLNLSTIEFKQNFRKKKENILRNPIWEQINEKNFFKRTSAFYVIERSLLRIFCVSKNDDTKYSFDFRLELQLGQNEFHHIHLRNTTLKRHGEFGNYLWNSINSQFDLLKYLKMDSYDDLLNSDYKLQLYIINSLKTEEETLFPINVNLKYIRTRPNMPKKNSIVCSKCFWYKKDQHKDLAWWIELNKQAGYKKVVFCNNTIPNTKEFNEIFERNKDFIELSQLNYLPNFINTDLNSSHNYLRYYYELGSDYHIDSDLFNMIITNECFLNNTHEYQQIAVLDNDEVIMPRINDKISSLNENFNFISKLEFKNDLKVPKKLTDLYSSCSNDPNKLNKYLTSIQKKSVTYHFNMGFYLKERQVRQIVETFESHFKNFNEFNISDKFMVKVVDMEPQSQEHNSYNFTFIFQNRDDINYAINLCKIYRNLIEEFEKLNKNSLEKYSNKFHRFFYIGGLLSLFACGKSIHSTDVTFDFTVHYPEPDKNYPEQDVFYHVEYNQGHLAHFRHVNEFPQKEISISELILDLNYINCFYKPIVEKYSKIKLF